MGSGKHAVSVVSKIGSHVIVAKPTLHCTLQADAYALSQGLTLVGYYQANQCIKDLELGALGKKIAEKIQSQTPQACALLVGACHTHIPYTQDFCTAFPPCIEL